MKNLISFCLLISPLLIGCNAKKAAQENKTEVQKIETTNLSLQKTEANISGLTFTSEGRKLEPPVKPEELASGTYYCDMGTVHYARSEKGDNTCPICKMKLTLKP